jgi:hypothetical protein
MCSSSRSRNSRLDVVLAVLLFSLSILHPSYGYIQLNWILAGWPNLYLHKVRVLVETYDCTWFLVLVQRNRQHWHEKDLAQVLLLESTPIWEIPDYDDDEDLEDEPWRPRCLLSHCLLSSDVISFRICWNLAWSSRLAGLASFRTRFAVLLLIRSPGNPKCQWHQEDAHWLVPRSFLDCWCWDLSLFEPLACPLRIYACYRMLACEIL